jgi:hypothetical protein
MFRSLFPSLLVVGIALAACASETGSPSKDDKPAGEAPTLANTPEPAINASMAKYNKDLPKRGDSLPAILGTTLSGQTVDNATLSGKTALINLWFYH